MIDILFLAHKRPEFTRESARALLANTDHSLDRAGGGDWARVTTYTDGAELHPYMIAALFHNTARHGGPVACMNAFLNSTSETTDGETLSPEATPEFICKLDNDTIVPPGWLPACLDVMRRYPNVDLLGIEPWTPDKKLFPRNPHPTIPGAENLWKFNPRPVSHIGGIGVFRRSALTRYGLPVPNSTDGRYGMTEWQWRWPKMTKAFIDPPLPVFLLDHLPFEPWVSFSRKYEAEGVQRNVGWMYDEVRHKALWDWWLASGEVVGAEGQRVGGSR